MLSIFLKLLLFSAAIFLLLAVFNYIKYRKDLFTVEVLNKSFFTMGFLAIFLIIIISLTVLMLN